MTSLRLTTWPADDESREGSRTSPAEIQKFPLRRLKLSIQKFQTVLHIDLERLQKHGSNMNRMIIFEDWAGLHKEQINASRTVQQVKATLRDLERTRAQVYEEEQDQFDEQVHEVKMKAVTAVENFLKITQADQLHPEMNYTPGDFVDTVGSTPASMPQLSSSMPSEAPSSLPCESPKQIQLASPELHVMPQNTQAAASLETLQHDMEELHDLVHQFSHAVEEQGEKVDRIEDNIEMAHGNVREGVMQLGKASKNKAALFPVVGAVIGGCVGGPVGILAGAKIGGVALAIGGATGYAGGRYLKSRHNQVVAIEMSNLSQPSEGRAPRRSTSTPELSTCTEQLPGTNLSQSKGSNFWKFFSWGKHKSPSEDST